jgi:predicted DNA binding CopG/RHH family protein
VIQEKRDSKNITIRMAVSEIERARALAGRKGIGYQTYIKMLLREALDREARKAR